MNKIYYFIHFSLIIQYSIIFLFAFVILIFLVLKCKTKDEELFKEIKINKEQKEILKKNKKNNSGKFNFFKEKKF